MTLKVITNWKLDSLFHISLIIMALYTS